MSINEARKYRSCFNGSLLPKVRRIVGCVECVSETMGGVPYANQCRRTSNKPPSHPRGGGCGSKSARPAPGCYHSPLFHHSRKINGGRFFIQIEFNTSKMEISIGHVIDTIKCDVSFFSYPNSAKCGRCAFTCRTVA